MVNRLSTQQRSVGPSVKNTVLPKSDLWCTYAACRTLKWLSSEVSKKQRNHTAENLLERKNRDGGFAWARGMASDVWATFYCVQALTDLGIDASAETDILDWVYTTQTPDGAFAMIPGQSPDIWATHYATRVISENFGQPIPAREKLLNWLARCQSRDGGLGWSPSHASEGRGSDVRACFYGIAAWRAATELSPVPLPWDKNRLVHWLQEQQVECGAFRLSPKAFVPCLWASFRATNALEMLGIAPTKSLERYLNQIVQPNGPVRWDGYDLPDVWAAFCWVGTARAVQHEISCKFKKTILKALANMALDDGGYTYRDPERAADSLAVSSVALINRFAGNPDQELIDWLDGCQMPNEGGIMYMPGRGAEIRCTHWAISAGAFENNRADRQALKTWLGDLQNPDGGFGYWEGRASDLVSTASALEIAFALGDAATLVDMPKLRNFLDSCKTIDGGYATVPNGATTARSKLQALRIMHLLGENIRIQLGEVLRDHQTPSGGVAAIGNRLPDLSTTYEAFVLCRRVGVEELLKDVAPMIARLRSGTKVSWSPMAPPTDELMPVTLATLMSFDQKALPALALS